MIKHIISLAAVVSALMVMTAGTLAGEPKAFDQEAFTKAKAEGKTVAVAFHADWCAVCKRQAAVIPLVLKEDKFQKVVAFTADYDKEKVGWKITEVDDKARKRNRSRDFQRRGDLAEGFFSRILIACGS